MSEERQTKYTIAEGYELPSNGLIYDKKIDPHVELRSMNARDEMKRLSPSTMPLKTLSDIIEGCMIEKPAIHVYDMSLGDYEYLLHKLRIVTYGGIYRMAITCPKCGNIVEVKSNLEELEIKPIDMTKFESLKTVSLPKSNKAVTINYTTPRMLEQATAMAKEMKKKFKDAELDFDLLTKLKLGIASVDGKVLTDFELETFINNLMALDMRKILKAIDELNNCFGVDGSLVVTCPMCGEDVTTFFRLGPDFFGPEDI